LSRKNWEYPVFDVLGLGSNCIDYLCLMDGYPREDEKTEVDVIEMQGGGNIGTALVAAACLGGSAAYHGVVGDDEYRDRLLEEFGRHGIDTQYVSPKEGKNHVAFILINRSNATRTIIYSKHHIPEFSPHEVNTDIITQTKVLLLDFFYEEVSLKASKFAKEHGVPVVIDAEWVCPYAKDILVNGSHLIISRSFALEFTGMDGSENMEEVIKKFSQIVRGHFVCITLGDRGSISFDREKEKVFWQKPFIVDTVDTTGAGDVFHGAFCYFLSQGYSNEDAVRYSSACSAMKCRQLGGRRGIPSLNELLVFLGEKRTG
jgi:sugar/nucleoside kinase (ribokinase family)